MRQRNSLVWGVGSMLVLLACSGDTFLPSADGGGGQSGGAAGAESGGGGASEAIAGSSGAAVGGSGVGGLGGAAAGNAGCTPCVPAQTGCVSAACEDAYCASTCQPTDAANAKDAREICRDGVCWMIVRKPIGSRIAAAEYCASLKLDDRRWATAYLANGDELAAMLAIAKLGLGQSGVPGEALWIDALWTPDKSPDGGTWAQPSAPASTPVPDPPFSKPALAVIDTDRGAKIKLQGKEPGVTFVAPNLADAGVLCRALP